MLVLAQTWVGAAHIYGEGTSNLLDAEGRVVGGVLAFAGAAALGAGLQLRLRSRAAGDGLIVVGALLGAIWFWTVLMTPLALIVLVGLALTDLRTTGRSTTRACGVASTPPADASAWWG